MRDFFEVVEKLSAINPKSWYRWAFYGWFKYATPEFIDVLLEHGIVTEESLNSYRPLPPKFYVFRKSCDAWIDFFCAEAWTIEE